MGTLMHRVLRNFKYIFLKSLILYQLTSRGTFYFKEYWRKIVNLISKSAR